MAKKHRLVFKRDVSKSAPNVVWCNLFLPCALEGFPLEMHSSDWEGLKRIAQDSNGRIVVEEEK